MENTTIAMIIGGIMTLVFFIILGAIIYFEGKGGKGKAGESVLAEFSTEELSDEANQPDIGEDLENIEKNCPSEIIGKPCTLEGPEGGSGVFDPFCRCVKETKEVSSQENKLSDVFKVY